MSTLPGVELDWLRENAEKEAQVGDKVMLSASTFICIVDEVKDLRRQEFDNARALVIAESRGQRQGQEWAKDAIQSLEFAVAKLTRSNKLMKGKLRNLSENLKRRNSNQRKKASR